MGLELEISFVVRSIQTRIKTINSEVKEIIHQPLQKPQFEWMKELSSRVYQYAFINLGQAFDRFFKKLGGYPKFKKKGRADSFTLDNCGNPIKLGGLNHNPLLSL